MRGYAGIITGVASSMIAFDVVWNTTTKPVEYCLALSFFIGLAAAIGFVALTGMASDKKHRPKKTRQARFVKLENGLSVMIQRSSGRKAA